MTGEHEARQSHMISHNDFLLGTTSGVTSGLLSLLEVDMVRSLFCAAAGKVDIVSSSVDKPKQLSVSLIRRTTARLSGLT